MLDGEVPTGRTAGHGARSQRILCVVGTRPEAIKLAPVVVTLAGAGWDPVVVTTGQHGHVADEALSAFGISADVALDPWSRGADLAALHIELVRRLSEVVRDVDPSAVIVQGDTASTLAGALAAFWAQVPVVHLEAGLRSGSLAEPFPEEANRRLVAQVAALHLAPTATAADALAREGADEATVLVVGNTVVDAVRRLAVSPVSPGRVRGDADAEGARPSVVVTCHRRENWGSGVGRVASALRQLVDRHPGLEVVVAAHPNPAVRRVLVDELAGVSSVIVRDAIDYPEFVRLLAQARVVVTDSGGVQEEAAALGVPAVVLREVTERGEGVDAGLAVLVGTDPDRIVSAVSEALSSRGRRCRPGRWRPCPYGDGRAADRTVAALGWLLEGTARPEPFVADQVPVGAVA